MPRVVDDVDEALDEAVRRGVIVAKCDCGVTLTPEEHDARTHECGRAFDPLYQLPS